MGDLAGQRVVITRAAHQSGELACALQELGAQVLFVSVIEIAPPSDAVPLREAAHRIDEYDWVIFTSANAVDSFVAQFPMSRTGQIRPKIAVIGSATAARARSFGLKVTVSPSSETTVSETLVPILLEQGMTGRKVLFPCAAISRDVLPDELRHAGAQVEVVEAYRTVIPADASDLARQTFSGSLPDWVAFASPSAVNNLVQLIGASTLSRVALASIGPVTSAAIRKHGLRVAAEALTQTSQALADAMASCNHSHD